MNAVATLPPRREHLTTARIGELVRQTLGLNGRQFSVRKRSSLTFVTVTLRDPAVDWRRFRDFVRSLNTYSVDATDYATGQAIDCETTAEVDADQAAPYLTEARAAVAKIAAGTHGTGVEVSGGKILWKQGRDYYVSSRTASERGCYIWGPDVESGQEWAIRALALQIARV